MSSRHSHCNSDCGLNPLEPGRELPRTADATVKSNARHAHCATDCSTNPLGTIPNAGCTPVVTPTPPSPPACQPPQIVKFELSPSHGPCCGAATLTWETINVGTGTVKINGVTVAPSGSMAVTLLQVGTVAVQDYGEVTPDILSSTKSYWNSGASLPAGRYRVSYVAGGLCYHGVFTEWTVNYQPSGMGYRIAYTENGAAAILPYPGEDSGTATFAACVTHWLANHPRVEFEHSGGTIGIYLQDDPYTDNQHGTPDPRFKLESVTGSGFSQFTIVATNDCGEATSTVDPVIDPIVPEITYLQTTVCNTLTVGVSWNFHNTIGCGKQLWITVDNGVTVSTVYTASEANVNNGSTYILGLTGSETMLVHYKDSCHSPATYEIELTPVPNVCNPFSSVSSCTPTVTWDCPAGGEWWIWGYGFTDSVVDPHQGYEYFAAAGSRTLDPYPADYMNLVGPGPEGGTEAYAHGPLLNGEFEWVHTMWYKPTDCEEFETSVHTCLRPALLSFTIAEPYTQDGDSCYEVQAGDTLTIVWDGYYVGNGVDVHFDGVSQGRFLGTADPTYTGYYTGTIVLRVPEGCGTVTLTAVETACGDSCNNFSFCTVCVTPPECETPVNNEGKPTGWEGVDCIVLSSSGDFFSDCPDLSQRWDTPPDISDCTLWDGKLQWDGTKYQYVHGYEEPCYHMAGCIVNAAMFWREDEFFFFYLELSPAGAEGGICYDLSYNFGYIGQANCIISGTTMDQIVMNLDVGFATEVPNFIDEGAIYPAAYVATAPVVTFNPCT